MYEKLLSEGKIGNVTLKNRVIMTAMGVDCAEVDGSAGQRVSDYYEERAKGGVGLIITEVTRVNNYHGLALGGQLSMASDDMIEPFSKLVDKVHSHGTKIFVQLHHPGRQNLSALAYSWNLLTKVGKFVPHFWDITFKTVLFEKENEPGGQLNLAKMPPNKDRMDWAIQDLTQGAKNAGVDIRLGTAATEENLKELKPYAIILASGGTPIIPRIEGLDGDNVCTVADVLSGKVKLEGKKVAVIGSGLTGLETAELLVEQGNTVTVAEMADKIGPGIWTQHYWDIVPNLDKAGVNMLPGHKLTRVDDTSVYLENVEDGNLKVVNVDAVVLSLGVRSVKDLEDAAKSIADRVICIGDANKPGKIVAATRDGLQAALAL